MWERAREVAFQQVTFSVLLSASVYMPAQVGMVVGCSDDFFPIAERGSLYRTRLILA